MGCYMTAVNPVATYASKYYNVTGDELDLISLVNWIINIPGLWFGLMTSISIILILCSNWVSKETLGFRNLHYWTI